MLAFSTAAVEEVIDLDPASLSDVEVTEAVVEVRRLEAQLAFAKVAITREFDKRRLWATDASLSAATWIAWRTHEPIEDVRADLRLGRRLRTMILTADALKAGRITVAHAHRLARANRPDTADAFPDSEAGLVDMAMNDAFVDFTKKVDVWEQNADKRDPRDHVEEKRTVHLSPGLYGTGILFGTLTPIGRATIGTELARLEQELFEQDWAEAKSRVGALASASDLRRTPGQRRHDALMLLAERSASTPADARRPEPLVTVLVGYETFAGSVCELADGTVLHPSWVSSILDRAWIERAVFDGPSRVLDLGRARRFTGALRRALEIRDRWCTHPGCDRPAERCQGDHIQPYVDGGYTIQTNGRLLCGPHNRARQKRPPPDDKAA